MKISEIVNSQQPVIDDQANTLVRLRHRKRDRRIHDLATTVVNAVEELKELLGEEPEEDAAQALRGLVYSTERLSKCFRK